MEKERSYNKSKNRKIKKSRVILLITLTLVVVLGISAFLNQKTPISKPAEPQTIAEEIVVLAYHHMVSDEEKKADSLVKNAWTLSTSEFEQQLQFLHDEGYKSLTLDEFYNWYAGKKEVPEKSVVITFDDGYLSSTHYAVPILKKFNFNAATFIIGWKVRDKKVDWDPTDFQTMTAEDMNSSSNKGTMAFFSHTYALHNNINGKAALLSKTKDELLYDFKWSAKINSIDYVAYPFGVSSDTYIEAAKESGVKMGFQFGTDRHAKKSDDSFLMPRYCIKSGMTIENFKAIFE